MSKSPAVWCVVPAAGVGSRMGASVPKQYLSLLGESIAERTLNRLLSYGRFEQVLVSVSNDDPYWSHLEVASHPRIQSVVGGKERVHSVFNAVSVLKESASDDDWVLVHDIARPCIRLSDITRLMDKCIASQQGAILAVPAVDTLKQVGISDQSSTTIETTLDRRLIWQALTPQMFKLGQLYQALDFALKNELVVTDEASAVESFGAAVDVVLGHRDNIKITQQDDLALAEFYLAQQSEH